MPNQEDAWAWVPVMFARFREWEQATVKQTSAAVRTAKAAALDTQACLVDRARQVPVMAKGQAAIVTAKCRGTLQIWARDYPEAVVGGSTLFAACAFGAANGSLLGRAPRRLTLLAAFGTYYLREPMAAKWGDSVAGVSSALSSGLKALAEARGLLPPPAPPTSPPQPKMDESVI